MRASSPKSTACTGTGNVIVASMLSASSLRKTRFVTTVARPPSISTSNLVETRGMGRCASTVNAPAIKAPRGSIVLGVAILGMGGLLEEVGKKALNAFDDRLDRCARGEKLGINNKRDSWRRGKWGAFTSLKEQFDSCRREAEIT